MANSQRDRKRCALCAEGNPRFETNSGRYHYLTDEYAPLCTAPSDEEYIAELEKELVETKNIIRQIHKEADDGYGGRDDEVLPALSSILRITEAYLKKEKEPR